MNIPKTFLNEEGRKYARYIFLSHNFLAKIPGVGKYAMSVLVSAIYAQVLKEGAIEHQRRRMIYAKRKAEMSRMRHGNNINGQRDAGEMREMRFRPEGIRTVQQMDGRMVEEQQESKNRERQ